MNKNLFSNQKAYYYIFSLFAYSTLLIGFFLNEDLSGGAIQDFNFYVPILNSFNQDFFHSFFNYKIFNSDHSPFFISILTIINIPFENLNLLNLSVLEISNSNYINAINYSQKYNFLRFIFLHVCLLIPFFLYQSLKLLFKDCSKFLLFGLSLVIVFSPHFRSYSIWIGETNLGLLFIIISIYYYIKIIHYNVNYKFIFLNVFFLALAAYARPVYSLISVYFLFAYYQKFGYSKELFYFIIFNICLALPAFYYFFIMDNYPFTLYSNFFYKPNITLYSTNIILSSSIILFYSVPFFLINLKHTQDFFLSISKVNIFAFIFAIGLMSLFVLNFNYNEIMNGGGIFYKTSNILFNNNYFLYFASFVSIYFILVLTVKDINDMLLILVIFCLDPDPWIYHKSFDPIIYCFFLTVFSNNFYRKLDSVNQKKFVSIVSVYYFLVFFIYIFIRT